jgi:hypothetical protein
MLGLFVLNLGIAFGAGCYEARIAFLQWFSDSSESGLRRIAIEAVMLCLQFAA